MGGTARRVGTNDLQGALGGGNNRPSYGQAPLRRDGMTDFRRRTSPPP